MANRIVIADASPLIGLASIESFDLLRKLFSRIVVTEAVRDEVLAGTGLPGASELAAAIEDGWVDVASVDPAVEFGELGAGEASVLALAARHADACRVLMDESLGRSYAKEHGFPVAGLVGLLLEAKNAKLVHEIRPLLERLGRADFRISDLVLQEALERAGED